MQTTNDEHLAADETDTDGSSVSNASLASSTTSVTSSILEYRIENGRTYHKYKDGSEFEVSAKSGTIRQYAYDLTRFNENETDTTASDLQHNLFIRTFDDRLGSAPPNDRDAKVGRVLDIGTGSGIWAIDFGDEHPESEFEIDDIEEPWLFSRPFDYIHSRMMTGSIRNWRRFLQNCFDNLNPGGYLELNDIDAVPVSDDGTLTEDTSLMKSVRLCCEAIAKLGVPYEHFSRFEGVLKEIGFEDVHIQRFKWPTNSWPKDKKHKEIGIWNYENFAPNWEGFLMAPLTRALDWTKEEVIILAMEARKDFANRNIHAYYNMWVILTIRLIIELT
ncbi:methyltransferase domain-containing protein [Colletotrichum tamarilloi]|uniref:Methyltransferase domain-containing protein n=1 Tax=Colletotrichum tamarilloi TaxID=1209934 RepID=A0ABQ9R0P9_9PEZI|nr:methyltransferase domain-containing protein [Colletotrichum tamarilloi]KAK1491252.1 methyltransferase domain-containing protein [Colletotrichum tamarilloi]